MRTEPDEGDALAELRAAARKAAEAGFFADYLVSVVRVAVGNVVPANPEEEVVEVSAEDGGWTPELRADAEAWFIEMEEFHVDLRRRHAEIRAGLERAEALIRARVGRGGGG